jgi:hypothetical protein
MSLGNSLLHWVEASSRATNALDSRHSETMNTTNRSQASVDCEVLDSPRGSIELRKHHSTSATTALSASEFRSTQTKFLSQITEKRELWVWRIIGHLSNAK